MHQANREAVFAWLDAYNRKPKAELLPKIDVMKGWHVMKTTRKTLILAFVLILSFVLAGCGSKEASPDISSAAGGGKNNAKLSQTEKSSVPESTGLSEEAETAEMETGDTSENNEGILIAYFSYTGNTKEAAQMIAGYTGGDLAEIKRAEEYGDLQEEAKAEIQDGIHPEITVSVSNVEDYDTVFVGYPIWWDEAPAMIAAFLAENDFSGKTIISFCTSASDDIGNSLHIFSELCPDAVIAEGLTANDLNDIGPWIEALGLMRQDTETLDGSKNDSDNRVEGTQIKMVTDNTEVVITLNDSKAASDLVEMLPLELTLIERNSFAKGMTLPEQLSSSEATTREYEIGDFGYWDAGPDLAIFYDDIYEQTIVDVIPLGHAQSGAEMLAGETGTVRLELVKAEGDETQNE